MRMYHPNLDPPHNEWEGPDSAAEVLAESGWKPRPDPADPEPGRAPEPVTYAPVRPADPEPKSRRKAD